MPLNLQCRYAPDDHGTFANPVSLAAHYEQHHGDVYARPERIECPDCHKRVAESGWAHHRAAHHAVDASITVSMNGHDATTAGRRRRCDVCGKIHHPNNTRRHFITMHPEVADWRMRYTDISAPSLVPAVVTTTDVDVHSPDAHDDTNVVMHPWHPDDIVIPAVEQLAQPSGMFPVAHLAAILVWRDATATMLHAVATTPVTPRKRKGR